MKKILILITIFIIKWFSNLYWSYINNFDDCKYWWTFSCTTNYVYWDDFKSEILVEKYDWSIEYWEFNDFRSNNVNDINYGWKEKYDGKYLTISKFYESKYWNHAIYFVWPYVNNSENDFTEKEIEEWKIELFKKYKDIVGLYIDDKRVWKYVLDWKVDYKNTDYFYIKNKILFYEEDYEYSDNFYLTKTDYVLKEKTIKILDEFVEKVEKIKYDKEKLLKKIDKVYNEYKNKEWRKNKFLAEVFLYLHNEVLINKLKQNKNLLKFSYNDLNY